MAFNPCAISDISSAGPRCATAGFRHGLCVSGSPQGLGLPVQAMIRNLPRISPLESSCSCPAIPSLNWSFCNPGNSCPHILFPFIPCTGVPSHSCSLPKQLWAPPPKTSLPNFTPRYLRRFLYLHSTYNNTMRGIAWTQCGGGSVWTQGLCLLSHHTPGVPQWVKCPGGPERFISCAERQLFEAGEPFPMGLNSLILLCVRLLQKCGTLCEPDAPLFQTELPH